VPIAADILPGWRELRAPTLVLVGEQDLLSFHLFAEEMAARIPNARKVVIAGAGHMANMERPDAVNAALIAFLRAR
jgi:3-oxoadipate enol-lactonase